MTTAEQEATERKTQGDRNSVGEFSRDLFSGEPVGAEITLHSIDQPVAVLGQQRLVDAEFGPLGIDGILGGVEPQD